MIVLMVENMPASVKGEITRWLQEIRPGVFLGNLSSRVREKLWDRICQNCRGGTAMIIWSSNNEQGFLVDFWGITARFVTEWEGLQLFTKHPKP